MNGLSSPVGGAASVAARSIRRLLALVACGSVVGLLIVQARGDFARSRGGAARMLALKPPNVLLVLLDE